MTVKELKQHYEVLKWKGVYLIHSKTEHGRFPHKYLCSANKKGQSWIIDEFKPTTKVEKFKENVEKYISNLEYNSEYFSPMYREGYKEVMYVHDYLESLGFKSGRGSSYTYSPKNIFGGKTTEISLSFMGLEKDWYSDEKEIIKIILHIDNASWLTIETKRSFKELKEGINSILKPLLITEGVRSIQDSDKMTTTSVDYIIQELNGLSLSGENYNQTLKKKLLEIAGTL